MKRRLAGHLVGGEVRNEVVRLAGEDHAAVGLPEDQRLMPWGVPWRRDDPDSRPHLGFTGELLIGRGGEIDQFVDGVAAVAGRGQLDVLDQDGPAAQERVPAAVVEVEVAVRDE